tara:strand:- start:1532 stop:1966 length:435 start_codon:yes stop_codon:yes gene_type:complete
MAYKGRFKPKHPEKYIGNPTNIIYRSLLERRFMLYCDTSKNILEWGSEEVIVPYKSPVDNKMHRYYVDFIVRLKNKEGLIETLLIEVKPKKQCSPPKKPKKKNRSYITEVKTWGVNSAKWKAATEYAENKGWKFKIMTEETLAP